MGTKETIQEIIDRWNSGDKSGARKLFFISHWLLPEKTREFFREKMHFEMRKTEIDPLAKEACDMLGGRLLDDNDMTIYEQHVPEVKK